MTNATQPKLVYLANQYLRDCHRRNLSHNTIERAYAHALRDFIRWVAQDNDAAHVTHGLNGRQRVTVIDAPDVATLAGDVDTERIRAFVEHKQQSRVFDDMPHPWMKPREQTLAPSTVHRYIRVLKTFFTWCVYEEWLDANPTERIKHPKLPNKGRRVEVFTEDEIVTVLETARKASYRNYALVFVMLDTLLRRLELLSLTMDDVNLGTGLITVKHGKGDKIRWLRAGYQCQRILRRYVREYRKPRDKSVTALFLNRRGYALTDNAIGSLFKRLSEYTEMRVFPHKLRHTGATLMAMHGENAPRIADRLGHETLEMANWYIHLAGMKAAQDDASPMDKLLSEREA